MPFSDAKLAKLDKERLRLKAEAKALSDDAAALSEKIIAELERRGTDTITHDGHKITLVQQHTTITDYDSMYVNLKPAKRKHVVKEVIDPSLLAQAVQEGIIKVETVAKYQTRQPKKPYLA